jgi:hypothetical protein
LAGYSELNWGCIVEYCTHGDMHVLTRMMDWEVLKGTSVGAIVHERLATKYVCTKCPSAADPGSAPMPHCPTHRVVHSRHGVTSAVPGPAWPKSPSFGLA